MSWKPEVQTDSTGEWYGDALRFETKREAELQVADLFSRRFAVRETRVVESTDPVNSRWVDGEGLVAVARAETDAGLDRMSRR